MKIILTGGGTMGSVSPLLAIAEKLKEKDGNNEFLWLGTKNGPEKQFIEEEKIPFKAIPSGKFRRYFSGWNFIDPFLIIAGFFSSLWIILKFKPKIIISAGGFVGVPVIWAGWILRAPSLIHQQDLRPGLANKLTARFAKIITVVFSESLKYFKKGIVVGNPAREKILKGDREKAKEVFKLNDDLPVLLILGGGTGALELNRIALLAAEELTNFCQVIHVTGGKLDGEFEVLKRENENYHLVDLLVTGIEDVFAAADLVVSRAGMGTLTELSVLGKPTILIPMPESHQEENAWYFKRQNAVHVLLQKDLMPAEFVFAVREIINDNVELANLSRNIKGVMRGDAAKKIAEKIYSLK
jgi:UDP-N-acetylglucosamine--N-acetylmuramyl-(pentapeptide) pyrophosphoryl-undecaprenol N-acetylglucosamine transferase